jgi:hypothetical protein
LRADSNSGENLIDCSVDFRTLECDSTMSFGDGGSENVEGCGFACSVGSQQAEGFSFLDDERVISDGDEAVGVLLVERVNNNRLCLIELHNFLFFSF